jgi:hypothetical protein
MPTFPRARHHIHELNWRHFVDSGSDEATRTLLAPVAGALHRWDTERA